VLSHFRLQSTLPNTDKCLYIATEFEKLKLKIKPREGE
jgi:hypothetical protein